MKTIKLSYNQLEIFYREKANTVSYTTNEGVVVVCTIPEKWGLSRVFQFMNEILEEPTNIGN